MKGRSLVETIMGAVVILVAGGFLAYAYDSANIRPVEGYEVKARFVSIDGLSTGADVRIGGVKIGTVTDRGIDFETYEAIVTMSIAPEIRLTEDTHAEVTGEGLIGSKYIKLDPGRSETFIAKGGEITRTKGVVSIEELLGKAIFLLSED
ncbi:MAG: outer membrane lipid asymmetry maintenance protein MlaD [Rhodospirillaceae bacterium]|jgi:phospholipid/cholesterol/gamma-HCH transport system substrate-binding protein|nr:outer membrane lipid asymmetry maintenance protein MlaD [Rhodospirillaceae bacterium]MBT6118466.1 outer membrane lipid asymmetry maintenance protein MlaD [Rhodospirillaceae bacterium]